MRGLPKENPIYVAPCTPALNIGQTQYFTDVSAQSLARVSFDRPRPMVAYAFWDPYKNNPGPGATSSIALAGGGNEIVVLGRIKVGNQESMIEFNFDIPWGQVVAIPVTAEQVEISARLIAPTPLTAHAFFVGPDFQTFNDPPGLVIPPGSFLPNRSTSAYPIGFVAVTGGIGIGSAGRQHCQPLTRSCSVPALTAAAPGNIVTIPLAYGARAVTVIGPASVDVTVRVNCFGAGPLIPLNTRTPLPYDAVSVTIANLSVVNPTENYFILYELAL